MTTNDRPRVLVTAAGGDMGQALIKALRLAEPSFDLFGCDADTAGIAEAFVNRSAVVPLASRGERYIEAVERLCQDWSIAAVVPASEPEIAAFTALGTSTRLANGAALVCQDAASYALMSDKLLCMQALRAQVSLVGFADGTDDAARERLAAEGFPIVVKARRSSGSKALRIAADHTALDEAVRSVHEPLVQSHIDDSGGEFSVGCYVGARFTAFLAFRRTLGPVGCSWYAETVDDPEVLDYARSVVTALGVRGAVNVQVRKGRNGVRLLEVNPRFSSLVAARAACGFRDAEWCVREALGQETPAACPPLRPLRFRRFFHEVIDVGEGYHAVDSWQPRSRRFA